MIADAPGPQAAEDVLQGPGPQVPAAPGRQAALPGFTADDLGLPQALLELSRIKTELLPQAGPGLL